MARSDQVTERFQRPIPSLAGKTVVRAYQESGDFHSLDGGYEDDGTVVIEFADGSEIAIGACGCNDDTVSVEFSLCHADVQPRQDNL